VLRHDVATLHPGCRILVDVVLDVKIEELSTTSTTSKQIDRKFRKRKAIPKMKEDVRR
jgi:hypothetical protein